MNQIKCIVLDIDFTLTKSDGSISDYTKSIIKKAKKKGIYVILCSGRPNIYTVEKSKISNASPIVISDNGATIYNYEQDKIVFADSIPKDILKSIWDLSLKYNLDCVLNSIKARYRHRMFSNSEYIKTNSNINGLDEIKDIVSQCVISSKEYNPMIMLKNEIYTNSSIEITNTNLHTEKEGDYYFIDINKKGISKGKAIINLTNELNIQLDEVICFGDSMNDKTMFDVLNNTVAMKNASEDLKKIAKYTTVYTNDEDGVAKFIEKYILN